MSAKKASELRDQKPEELEVLLQEQRATFFKIKNDKRVTKKNDQPHLLKATRRQIARVLTVLGEKQRAERS